LQQHNQLSSLGYMNVNSDKFNSKKYFKVKEGDLPDSSFKI